MFEAIGVLQKSVLQDRGPHVVDRGGQAGVQRRRCHESDARVTVHIVVPMKECFAKGTCFLDRLKPVRKRGPVFQGLEL